MSAGSFAAAALRLARVAAALGWRPDEFWRATPAELAVLLTPLGPAGDPVSREEVTRLKEMFPDG